MTNDQFKTAYNFIIFMCFKPKSPASSRCQTACHGVKHYPGFSRTCDLLHKCCCGPLPSDNFYGTPKPPAEPSPAAPPLNVSEALLPGARPSAQGKRKRNQSVSNMEQRASLEPPEEEEEDSPVVNGNGVAITPGTVKYKKFAIFPPTEMTSTPGRFHKCHDHENVLQHHIWGKEKICFEGSNVPEGC